MLLFHLGLEFSVRDLLAGGRSLATAGVVFLGLNVAAGAALGFAFGWGDREALVIAGAVAISSSAIVTKLLTELRRLGHRETPLILGIVVVEDVFLALYLAVVQPILSDASGTEILVSIASAFGFLLGFAIIARFATGILSAGSSTPTATSCSSCASSVSWSSRPASPRRSASPTRSPRCSSASSSPRRA